jgi:hypothetical protein
MKKFSVGALAIVIGALALLLWAFRFSPTGDDGERPPESAVAETKAPEPTVITEEELKNRASRQLETEKMWAGIREFGNVTRIKAGNCWVGQYSFNNPKDVRITNEEWEILMKVFCFLQGQEYQCEQLTTMESPLPRDMFLSLLAEEATIKLLGEELLKAIKYDTEREIEYHGVALSKLNSIVLLEKKFDIVEHEAGACENDEN